MRNLIFLIIILTTYQSYAQKIEVSYSRNTFSFDETEGKVIYQNTFLCPNGYTKSQVVKSFKPLLEQLYIKGKVFMNNINAVLIQTGRVIQQDSSNMTAKILFSTKDIGDKKALDKLVISASMKLSTDGKEIKVLVEDISTIADVSSPIFAGNSLVVTYLNDELAKSKNGKLEIVAFKGKRLYTANIACSKLVTYFVPQELERLLNQQASNY